ncbi:hypothetical protein [Arthrobacter pityocampae]|uniref:hypothetical protein n=1 Tax=Arthrobacter pityocampae TaxID=547334 RepID=UPI0037361087
MNHDAPDGAEGLFRPQLQSALAVAGRLGEMLARQRAERNEQIQRAEQAQRRQLEERFEAERAVMRTQLAAVHQPQFWESARPEDIPSHYAMAQQWEKLDSMALVSREQMEDEIRTRYKLTPEEYLEAHKGGLENDVELEQASENKDAHRDHAVAEQQSGEVARGDFQNDLDTQTAAANAEELWDSGDRRAALADALMTQFGNDTAAREGVEAFLAADLSNGTPPLAAVTPTKRPLQNRMSAQWTAAKDKGFGLK